MLSVVLSRRECAVTPIDVLNKLHAVGLLPEDERVKHAKFATALAHDDRPVVQIEKGIVAVDEAIAEFDSQGSDQPDYGDYSRRASSGPSGPDSRSIFDDVDE